MSARLALLLGTWVLLPACSPDAPPAAPATTAEPSPSLSPTPTPRVFPQFDDAHLQAGRAVWLGTCAGCHDVGIAGAPVLGDVADWAPRIAQGREVLLAHAREGFFGSGGTMMPARGGNESLSDADIAAAVDYMVAASRAP